MNLNLWCDFFKLGFQIFELWFSLDFSWILDIRGIQIFSDPQMYSRGKGQIRDFLKQVWLRPCIDQSVQKGHRLDQVNAWSMRSLLAPGPGSVWKRIGDSNLVNGFIPMKFTRSYQVFFLALGQVPRLSSVGVQRRDARGAKQLISWIIQTIVLLLGKINWSYLIGSTVYDTEHGRFYAPLLIVVFKPHSAQFYYLRHWL